MRPRKTRFAEAPWSLVNPCWLLVNESVVVEPENPGPRFSKILQNFRDTILRIYEAHDAPGLTVQAELGTF